MDKSIFKKLDKSLEKSQRQAKAEADRRDAFLFNVEKVVIALGAVLTDYTQQFMAREYRVSEHSNEYYLSWEVCCPNSAHTLKIAIAHHDGGLNQSLGFSINGLLRTTVSIDNLPTQAAVELWVEKWISEFIGLHS